MAAPEISHPLNRAADRQCSMLLAAVALLLLAVPARGAEPTTTSRQFDHTRTGFPLTGAHSRAECAECHARGVFKGTPRECSSCHTTGSGRATTSKPANHIQTTAPCGQCHRSSLTWAGAKFDHAAVAPGSCTQCHNGVKAPGKPNDSRHQGVTSSCDTCHSTSTWLGARFNHAGVTPGTCTQCHNGSRAVGKPNNCAHQHNAQCDQCHSMTTFFGARFNHTAAGVVPGTCATCHGTGGCAQTKVPVPHYAGSCDQCHNTNTFVGAKFDHSAVTPGTCATCHGTGVTARTKVPVPHFSGSCDLCHTTTAFIPNKSYTHISAYFKPHNAGVTCYACHTGRTNTVSWPTATYQPDCAGCHATRYKSGPHKKTETPTTILYTVSELRNCAGSCHIYTDNTFTTIKTTRNSKHRSTDGGF